MKNLNYEIKRMCHLVFVLSLFEDLQAKNIILIIF